MEERETNFIENSDETTVHFTASPGLSKITHNGIWLDGSLWLGEKEVEHD